MQKEVPYYLYKITNNVNGKAYIGITKNPETRKRQHFFQRKQHKNLSLIILAIDKYGVENFDFQVLCIGTKEYILDLEMKAISLYRTREKKFGYNIKPGGESGRGYKLRDYPSDTPHFVSGFWFPNRRTAVEKLKITVDVFKNRQKKGTLGDLVQTKPKTKWEVTPCYLGGFWFPNLKTAISALDRSEQTLRCRISRGFGEEARVNREQNGENNHMYGIDPKDHPSSKSVIVEGIEYDSIKQATAATGYSKYIINQRIKSNHPDFSYRGND